MSPPDAQTAAPPSGLARLTCIVPRPLGRRVTECLQEARFGELLIEPGRAADFVFLDRAQHTAGRTLLESVALGDIPGVGMVVIDGVVRCGRSRNTPPAWEVPLVVTD